MMDREREKDLKAQSEDREGLKGRSEKVGDKKKCDKEREEGGRDGGMEWDGKRGGVTLLSGDTWLAAAVPEASGCSRWALC